MSFLKRKVEKYINNKKKGGFHFDPALTMYDFGLLLLMKLVALIRANLFLLFRMRSVKLWFFQRGIIIDGIRDLTAGSNLVVGEHARLNCLGKSGINFGNNCNVGSFSRFVVSTDFSDLGEGINIGNNVGIGSFAVIGGTGGVDIGDDTIIGPYLTVHSENHVYSDASRLIRLQGVERGRVRIGRNCWIGGKVTILSGVEIGDGSIIAANSLLNRNVPAGVVVAGVPARFIKTR